VIICRWSPIADSKGVELVLRRIQDVEVEVQSGLVGLVTKTRNVVLRIGADELPLPHRLTAEQLVDMEQCSRIVPVSYLSLGRRNYWRYDGGWYVDDTGLDAGEVRTALTDRAVARELACVPLGADVSDPVSIAERVVRELRKQR
jgi:hypothetical protein